jgi:nicotinamide mononucleotide transporter
MTLPQLLELIGFVSGVLCVWLVARQNIWNWPVGIVNNLAFLALFSMSGLYANGALQLVYLALAVYGWWSWAQGRSTGDALTVTVMTRTQWVAIAAIGVAGTAAITWLLAATTPSTVPSPDAVTTVLSLLATWGQARKKLECWWLWIAADLIFIPLYASQGLWLTAALYVGFLALCCYGLWSWTRSRAAVPA